MTIAVITARKMIRRFAVAKTLSTASAKRLVSRSCWLNAWTIFIAPRTSLVTAPTSAMRSWLSVEIARTLRPRNMIGPMISGTPSSISPASLGASANRMMMHADAHDDVAQRHRHGGADDLFDDRGVDRDPAGDFGRAIFLEEAGREAQQVAVDREADVGDGALAEPRHEVEAHRGRERHDRDQEQQIFEPAGDVGAVARSGCEALVDDQLEGIRNARGCPCRDQQRNRGDGDVPGVSRRESPDHAQAFEGSAFRAAGRGGHGRSLTVWLRRLNCRSAAFALQH